MKGRDPGEALGVVESILLLVTVVALLATAGGWVQQRLGLGGLAVTEIGLVLAPAVLVVRLQGLGRSALGLERPSGRSLAGGLLAGLGGFYLVSAVVETAVERILPLPPELREGLRRVIVPVGGRRPLAIDLAVLALAPAVCEEILFRGALLGAWLRAGKGTAVAASALAFGMFHLSLYKLIPTAALGLLAAILAVRARSVVPAMVMHLVNNTAVVLLVRAGFDDPPPVGTPLGLALFVGSIAALASGIWLTTATSKSEMPRTGMG